MRQKRHLYTQEPGDRKGLIPDRYEFLTYQRVRNGVHPYHNFPEKVKTGLYGFQHPRAYAELLLRPVRKLKTDLIIAEWDNLRRIFASLALKTPTHSIIVRKLNAYARRNKTCQALQEYDHIFCRRYLLEYISPTSPSPARRTSAWPSPAMSPGASPSSSPPPARP